jgi:hypothetical protein
LRSDDGGVLTRDMPTEPTGRDPKTREVLPKHCPNGHALVVPNVTIGSDVSKIWVLCRTCGTESQINHPTGEQTIAQRRPG